MNVNQVNKLLIAVVVLLLGGIGVLVWQLRPSRRYEAPPPPPVPAGVPAADRAELEKHFKTLQESLAKYAATQAERDRRLEEQIAAAAKAEDPALEQRLRATLDRQRHQWDEFQKSYRAWEERLQQPPVDGQEETSVERPPSPPPLDEGGGEEPAPPGDDGFGALADTIGAGLCIAQPELCPAILVFLEIFKGLSPGDREELVRLGEAVALGQGVPPDVVDAAGKVLREHPEARKAIEDLIRRRAELELPQSPGLENIKELREILDLIRGKTKWVEEVEALLRKGLCKEACSRTQDRWDRATDLEKGAVQALAGLRPEWGQCLDPCLAQLAEDRR